VSTINTGVKEFRRSPLDEFDVINTHARQNTWALANLKESGDFDAVRCFRDVTERLLLTFDKKMVALLSENVYELTTWASRMRLARAKLDVLDRNIPFAGRRQFNWDEVLPAMGLLDALRVGAEQTLSENGL